MEIKAIAEILGSIFGIIPKAAKQLKKRKMNKNMKHNKEDGYYYDKNDECPFCPRCYEVDSLKVHIVNGKCPECKTVYKSPTPVVAVAAPVRRSLFKTQYLF